MARPEMVLRSTRGELDPSRCACPPERSAWRYRWFRTRDAFVALPADAMPRARDLSEAVVLARFAGRRLWDHAHHAIGRGVVAGADHSHVTGRHSGRALAKTCSGF